MPLISSTEPGSVDTRSHCGVPAHGCRRLGDGSCSCACCGDPHEPTYEVSRTSFDRAARAQAHASETGEPEAWSVAGDAWEEHGDEVSASFCRGMATLARPILVASKKAPVVLHLMTQRDQPYGSERRCCERCGVVIWGSSPPAFTNDPSRWEATGPATGFVRCDEKEKTRNGDDA